MRSRYWPLWAAATCLLAILLGLILASRADAATIYVQNKDSRLSNEEIRKALPVFEAAANQDFAPAWGEGADLVFAPAPAGAWSIELTKSPKCLFCGGYHGVVNRAPHAVVGVFEDDLWTIIFTHELWEMLADPFINRGMLVSPRPGKNVWYALETADPVEAEEFAYTREGLRISDFVFESWFRRGSLPPYDFTRSVKRPLQVLEGGYQLVWRNGTYVSKRGHLRAQ